MMRLLLITMLLCTVLPASAFAQSSTAFTLTWSAATDNVGVSGYGLERCQGAGCTNFSQIAFIADTNYIDAGLSYSTSYTYRVRARDTSNNWGNYSNIATKVTPPSTQQSLVLGYALDAGSGSTITDASTYVNNGTATNTTWTASGHTSNALVFNGSTSYVSVPDSDSLDVVSGYTLEAWVYLTALPSGSWATVISKSNYTMAVEPSGLPLCYQIGTQQVQVTASVAISTNTWAHVACTYNGAVVTVYVNGTASGSYNVTGPIQTNTTALTIGGVPSTTNWLTGRIDDVRVYNRALSTGEITTDKNTAVASVALGTPTTVTGFGFGPVTNGTIELQWLPPSDPTWTFSAQWQTFANPTPWANVTLTTPEMDIDGNYHASMSFTPFAADAATDHYACFNARFLNSAGTGGPWLESSGQRPCTQIPVPSSAPPSRPVILSWSHRGLDTMLQPESDITFTINRANSLSGTYTQIATGVRGRSYLDDTAPSPVACYELVPKDQANNAGSASLKVCTNGTSLGGQSSGTATYDSVSDYSGVQGPTWYYLDHTLANMTFKGTGIWEGGQVYQQLWSDGGLPGYYGYKVTRRWVCPQTGNWIVSGTSEDGQKGYGGDGVTVLIKKDNTTTLYSRNIPDNGGAQTYSVNFSCNAGDTIDGTIDFNSTGSYDLTIFTMHFVGGAIQYGLTQPFAVAVSGTAPNYIVRWSHTSLDINGQQAPSMQFKVQRSDTLGGAKTTLLDFPQSASNQRSYVDTTAGATAFYWISAKTPDIISDLSQPGCKGTCPSDTVSPSIPYAVTVSGTSPNFTVKWSHSGLDADGKPETGLSFRVQRAATVGGARTTVCDWGTASYPGVRTCNDTGAGATAFYWVEARDTVPNTSTASQPGCKGAGCPADTIAPSSAFSINPVYK